MIPTALPTDTEPTHLITLQDRHGAKVGLIACDNKGARDDRAITRTPLDRSGIKIAQGQGKYSDRMPPLSEVDQDNWTGGLGLRFLEDRERYYHGENLETSLLGRALIGPAPHSASSVPLSALGGVFFDGPIYGSVAFVRLIGANRFLARKFTTTGVVTINRVQVWVQKRGVPGGDLRVRIHADNAGVPGTQVASMSVGKDDVAALEARLWEWRSLSVVLSASTSYWIVVSASSALDTNTDCWAAGCVGAEWADHFGAVDAVEEYMDFRFPEVRKTHIVINGVFPYWVADTGYKTVGGKVKQRSTGTTPQLATLSTGVWPIADVAVAATITRPGGDAGVVVRYTDASNYIVAYGDGTNIYLKKVVAGVVTTVGTFSYAWAAGTTHRLEVRCSGTSFAVAVDGTELGTATITDFATVTTHGLYSNNLVSGQTHDFDDFSVSQVAEGKKSSDGSTWVVGGPFLRYRAIKKTGVVAFDFFEYKGALYIVENTNATPRIYINGDRGVATGTQTTSTLQDTTKAWTVDQWKGAVIKVTGGANKGEWSLIRSNTSNTITVDADEAWTQPVTGAGGTEYVIVGSDYFTEITGHGMTGGAVKHAVVSQKDVVYFTRKDTVNIRRMREYNNAGVWTREFADDGTNKAVFLVARADSVSGPMMERAQNNDANGDVSVSSAATQPWGVDLSFGSPILCGPRDEPITGLEVYGSPERLVVLKEGTPGTIIDGVFNPFPLRETMAMRSEDNGVGHVVHNLYLYYSFGIAGVERYYRDELDDMGPNRDDGLVPWLTVPVVKMLSYPGRLFAGLGTRPDQWWRFRWDGWGQLVRRSSILKHNGQGWHPWYVHPADNIPLVGMYIQTIPGPSPDRLWVSLAGERLSELIYLHLPSGNVQAGVDPNYERNHQAVMQLSYCYYDYVDAQKFFDRIKIVTETMLPGTHSITGKYDADDGTGWHAFDSELSAGGEGGSLVVKSSDGHQAGMVQGQRLSVMLFLNTEDPLTGPVIRAAIQSGVQFLDTKYRVDINFRLADEDLDFEGDEEEMVIANPDGTTSVIQPTAKQKADQLAAWASRGEVLTMRSILEVYDNHVVSIDPASFRPFAVVADEGIEAHVAQVGFVELR